MRMNLLKRIKKILSNKLGSAYLIVLAALLMVLVMGGSVMLAAYTNVGNATKKQQRQQSYYYINSTAEMVRSMVEKGTFTNVIINNIEKKAVADYINSGTIKTEYSAANTNPTQIKIDGDSKIITLSITFIYKDIGINQRYSDIPIDANDMNTYSLNATLDAAVNIEYGTTKSDITAEFFSYENTDDKGTPDKKDDTKRRLWTFECYDK